MIGLQARAFACAALAVPALLAAATRAFWLHSSLHLAGALILLAAAYDWILRKPVYNIFFHPLQTLPSPRGELFALGHGLRMLNRPTGPAQTAWLLERADSRGLVVLQGFFYSSVRVIVVSTSGTADVLGKQCYNYRKNPAGMKLLRHLIGDGLVTVEGQVHRAQRKAAWPAFQGNHIASLVPVFWKKAAEYVDALAAQVAAAPVQTPVNLGPLTARATLDIIGVATIGRDMGSLQDPDNELALSFGLASAPSGASTRAYMMACLMLPIWLVQCLPWQAGKDLRRSVAEVKVHTARLLAEQKAKDQSASKEIVSLLLQAGSFNDDELIDQFRTFLAAGHETTSSALQWTTYLLARHPEIQTRLRKELTAVIGTQPLATLTSEIFDQLPFLNAVCQESLRLCPPVQMTTRVAAADSAILGQLIPKGTQVVLPIQTLNTQPETWGPDAAEFSPDRWLHGDEADGLLTRTAGFMTFIHGPRSCIGQDFSRFELKALVGAIFLRFNLKLADPSMNNVQASGGITVKPKGIRYVFEAV